MPTPQWKGASSETVGSAHRAVERAATPEPRALTSSSRLSIDAVFVDDSCVLIELTLNTHTIDLKVAAFGDVDRNLFAIRIGSVELLHAIDSTVTSEFSPMWSSSSPAALSLRRTMLLPPTDHPSSSMTAIQLSPSAPRVTFVASLLSHEIESLTYVS